MIRYTIAVPICTDLWLYLYLHEKFIADIAFLIDDVKNISVNQL